MSLNTSYENFMTSNHVTPFARGTYKKVWHGHWESGPCQGEEYVLKTFAGDSVLENHYFDVKTRLFQEATQIIKSWNDAGIIDRRIVLSVPEVVHDATAGEMCLAEPFIQDFQKFNSNTGWEAPLDGQYSDAMQALSHFSYINSRMMVLCDIQGGIYRDEM